MLSTLFLTSNNSSVILRQGNLDSTNVVFLSGTDMSVQIISGWEWILSGLINFSFENLTDFLFHCLEFLLSGPLLLNKHPLANKKRVSGVSDLGDFSLVSVGDTWIGHGVTVVSVGARLNEEGTIFNDELASPLHCFTNHKDVLSINLNSPC